MLLIKAPWQNGQLHPFTSSWSICKNLLETLGRVTCKWRVWENVCVCADMCVNRYAYIYITMWREELHLNTKHFTYIDNLKMVNLYIRNQQVVYILYLEGWYNRYIHIWIYKQQMVIKCRNNISNAWYRMVIPFYFPIFSYFFQVSSFSASLYIFFLGLL